MRGTDLSCKSKGKQVHAPMTCCGLGVQVTLYDAPAAAASLGEDFHLTMDTPLSPGMQMAAYYAEEHNSNIFASRVRSTLAQLFREPSAVQLQYGSHHSTVMFLKVLGALSKELLVGHLIDPLQRSADSTIVLVKCSPDCVFEVQKGTVTLLA